MDQNNNHIEEYYDDDDYNSADAEDDDFFEVPHGSLMTTNEYGDISIEIPPPNRASTFDSLGYISPNSHPVSLPIPQPDMSHAPIFISTDSSPLNQTPRARTPRTPRTPKTPRTPRSPTDSNNLDPEADNPGGASSPQLKKASNNLKKEEKKKKLQQEMEEAETIPFFHLYRFADGWDKLLMFIGSLAAIANGAAIPCISIIFGQVVESFDPKHFNEDPSYSIANKMREVTMWFLIVGAACFLLSYLETALWTISGERQTNRARVEYLSSILRQEIGWFDTNKANELASRINSDTILFQDAIGEKVGHFLHNIATFVAGFAIGFTKGWQLTLVIASVSPLLAIGGGFMAKMMTEMVRQGQEAYSVAGGIAEENISSIRTVSTFSGEVRAVHRYSESLKQALKLGYKKSVFNGFGLGFVQFVILGTYALAFWYGSTLVSKGTKNDLTGKPWTGGDVVSVFFGVIIGATAIGQASPALASFANGRGAAFKIFQVIDRVSKANPFSTRGKRLDRLTGEIEFRNVGFTYPSRPDIPIFKDFNLTIKPGQTIGLVGDSGGGKSTIISLLERFYDPQEGQILLDGEDIRRLNVRALRQKIGLVSQEPVLFATSIAENIRYGKDDATQEEIERAATLANAHSFISNLPQGYNTLVGEKGVQMSGGQRQRIAIARAIIKNPSILLLDEATSALDSENERIVQEAIDILMKGRTTILIAHRLSTIRDADVIVFVKHGSVVERGSHEELMAKQGYYFRLVEKQNQQQLQMVMETGRSRRSSTFSDVNPLLDSFRPSKKRSTREKKDGTLSRRKKKSKSGPKDVPFSRVIGYSRPEILLFFFGFLAAVGTGAIYPAFSIVFSKMLTIIQNSDPNYITKEANFISLMFVVLAVGSGVSNFFQAFFFGVIGEKLTFRLRVDSFKSIMRQSIGWFDLSENSSGKLTTALASDASLVQGMTSQRLGILLQNVLTIIGGLVIALIASWKLTLAIIATFPLVVITGQVQMKFLKGFSSEGMEGSGAAGQVASEAITGIRTVASFTTENQVLALYKKQLKIPINNGIKKAHIAGVSFGISTFIIFGVYCLSFWYGGYLVGSREWPASQQDIADNCNADTIPLYWADMNTCTRAQDMLNGFTNLMRVFFAIVLSAIGVGQASSLAPDIAKAKAATNAIFALIDQQSAIDPSQSGGETIQVPTGDIELKNVYFAYPSRPNNMVFRGFNILISSGTTTAFVGDSGGGKSTIISLLQRFYNPSQGEIFIDGHNIRNLNVKHLRSLFGMVGQEPTMFSGTIAENIAYGKVDATQEEVENAAKLANAHGFITEFTDGYNTQVGDKFTQLSGGQKQRLAIARAIIRDPKILLLDEATSALDNESEKLVQQALENVMKGRTTLVIAHRLSTIQNADCIAFVRAGQIIERGTHEELMELDGYYAALINRQNLN